MRCDSMNRASAAAPCKSSISFSVLHSAVGSRHFTISNFHTNRTRIDWVNRLCTCVEKNAFISHFTICIWWWLSYIFPTNIHTHTEKPTGTHWYMLTMIPKRPLLHEFENGREIQRRARWAAAPSTLCNSRILHEQIVKWNGSQTYISQDIYHIHEHMLFFFVVVLCMRSPFLTAISTVCWILCIFAGHILSLSRQYFVRFILGNVFVNCAISAI